MDNIISLLSPNILIIDPIFLNRKVINYFLKLDIRGHEIYSIAEKANNELFPEGRQILGLFKISNFKKGKYKIDVTQIVRVFKKDFEEYELSEACLFGVESAEILIMDLNYLKDFFLKNATYQTEVLHFLKLLNETNTKEDKHHFKFMKAFDVNNSFTDFIGDGRYAVTEDFITPLDKTFNDFGGLQL